MNILVLLLIWEAVFSLFVCFFFIYFYLFVCMCIYIYFFFGRNIEHNPYNTYTVIVTVHDLCEKKSGRVILKATDIQREWYSVC